MPRRRRVREFRRKLAKAIQKAEAEVRAEDALASASPLDDIFWREYEQGSYCCPDCDYNHPDAIAWDARQEINAYLKRESHA